MSDATKGVPRLNRQQFLKTAAGAAGALGVIGAGLTLPVGLGGPEVADAAPSGRSFGATRFALELGGTNEGYLHSVEGGNASADVIEEAAGASFYSKKHIGQPRYEDIVMGLRLQHG